MQKYVKYNEHETYTLMVYGEIGDTLFCAATYLPLENVVNEIVNYLGGNSYSDFRYIQFFPSSKKILDGMEYVEEMECEDYKNQTLPGLIHNWSLFGKPEINVGVESLFKSAPDSAYETVDGLMMCKRMFILPTHLECN